MLGIHWYRVGRNRCGGSHLPLPHEARDDRRNTSGRRDRLFPRFDSYPCAYPGGCRSRCGRPDDRPHLSASKLSPATPVPMIQAAVSDPEQENYISLAIHAFDHRIGESEDDRLDVGGRLCILCRGYPCLTTRTCRTKRAACSNRTLRRLRDGNPGHGRRFLRSRLVFGGLS
jgi:hypothetical protein